MKLLSSTIDPGEAKTFERSECTIDEPDYLRGRAKSFRLEVLQADGQWHPAHRGNLYGILHLERFPAAAASQASLLIDAPVTRFDHFPTGK